MSLKNYTSNTPQTFDKIQKVLASHGANKIMFDYENGRPVCISFSINIDGKDIGFKLPSLIENVYEIMYGGKDKWGNTKEVTDAKKEQAYRTGWANIRDWIDAQMALVDTRQVQLVQVFLPYAVTKSGDTVFETMVKNPNLLLN